MEEYIGKTVMIKKWFVRSSETILSNPFLKVRQDVCELPNGLVIPDYYVIEEADVGGVFGITSDRQVLFVEQYKHACGEICLELPGGFFEGDDPLEEVRREFIEETGYDAKEYVYLGALLPNPTRTKKQVYMFLGLDAFPVGEQHLDPSEEIMIHHIPLEEIMPKVRSGEIRAVDSLAGVLLAMEELRVRGWTD